MIVLNKQQVIGLHQRLIDATGGTHGLRDEGILSSSLSNAFVTFDGKDLYPTIIEKAANFCFSLIGNHPFVDGNKRIGIYVLLVFLEVNGVNLYFTQDELVQLGLGIADGSIKQPQIIEWIQNHIE